MPPKSRETSARSSTETRSHNSTAASSKCFSSATTRSCSAYVRDGAEVADGTRSSCRSEYRVGRSSLHVIAFVRRSTMTRSTITSKRQTTVPKEVCDALEVGPGDKITWEVNGGRGAGTTQRPAPRRGGGSGEGGRDAPARGRAE